MDKKAILAVMLSLGIWVAWQKFYLEPIQKQAALHAEKQEADRVAAAKLQENKEVLNAKGIMPNAAKISVENKVVTRISLENADTRIEAGNEPFAFQSWELKSFSKTMEKKAEDRISLLGATGHNGQVGLRFSDAAYTAAVMNTWDSVEKVAPDSVVSRIATPELSVERTVKLNPSGYGASIDYRFQFHKEAPKFVFLDLFGNPKRENDKEGSIFGQAPDKVHVTFRDANKRHSELAANHKETIESAALVKWIGLDTRYFVLGLVPGAEAGAQVVADNLRENSVRGTLVYPTEGKKDFAVSTKAYFGPKEMANLKSVDPVLVDSIDFGWTSFLAVPLLQALKWLYGFCKNYGLAIILLTFGIKMLLFPLTYKSMKSMSKIAKLQPQLNALREKYKDNKEKLNVEMMNFMKTNGYNPVGGCLPILLQMPIFFALYRVLFNSMELYQAPFIWWIHDLSSPDPLFIAPVLLTGLMYLQQKLSPSTAADPMQQKMLQFMPVVFGMFMLLLPAGLNIYMVVNSATSIAQQWVLNRKLGLRPAGGGVVAKA